MKPKRGGEGGETGIVGEGEGGMSCEQVSDIFHCYSFRDGM